MEQNNIKRLVLNINNTIVRSIDQSIRIPNEVRNFYFGNLEIDASPNFLEISTKSSNTYNLIKLLQTIKIVNIDSISLYDIILLLQLQSYTKIYKINACEYKEYYLYDNIQIKLIYRFNKLIGILITDSLYKFDNTKIILELRRMYKTWNKLK